MTGVQTCALPICEFTHHGPEEVFITAVTLIGSFAILSRSSLPLTLIIFAIFPLIVLAAVWKKRKMNRAFAQMRRTVGEMNAELESSIAGIRVSRASPVKARLTRMPAMLLSSSAFISPTVRRIWEIGRAHV